MDVFLQDINTTVYMKWIVMQNKKYDLNIHQVDNEIFISNDEVEGKIILYNNNIFEEVLFVKNTEDRLFYLHFQMTHLNHAVELFEELVHCALEATHRPSIRVLLCCSGGYTTTLFADNMQTLAKLENFNYVIDAVAYARLIEVSDDYDLILLAPQVAYMLPMIKRMLPEKRTMMIPTKAFATNDYSEVLKLVHQVKEEMSNEHK